MAIQKILFIGANDRAMLSMAKQAHNMGYSIDCTDIIDVPFHISRFINAYYRLPDYRRDANQFVKALISLCQLNSYDYAIFIHDDTLELYMTNRLLIDNVVNVICPPTRDGYELSHNKSKLLDYCQKLNFKIPKGQLIQSILELELVLPNLIFPLIAKPVSTAIVCDGHLVNFNVKKIATQDKLIDFVREHIVNTPILLQEIVNGKGAGVNFVAKNGKVLQRYIHIREREAYGGGVSSLRSIRGDNYLNLFDHLDAFVAATNWSGLGMLEFKVDGYIPYLMELNARAWGSIEAGVIAGYNIPQTFFKTFIEKSTQQQPNVPTKPTTVINSKLDLQYSLSELTRVKKVSPIVRWCYDVFLNPRIKVEDSLFNDFRFNLYNHFDIVIASYKKWMNKRPKPIAPLIAKESLINKNKIGFICFGNICRSPFAHIYAMQKSSKFSFSSYGMNTEPNRLPPTNATLAALKYGVNIQEHLSEVLTEAVCDREDVLIFMDRKTYWEGVKLFPTFSSKMYVLRTEDISDPYGYDLDYFNETYRIIATRIDECLL